MPDRIIRESICTSETLNQLTDFEERFWHRLIVNCDDYGRFDARPAILKGRLFPLMDGKTHRNMADALNKLASVGLVELYKVDGKPFLRVVTWDKYQRIRAKRSKFPDPSEGLDSTCCQLTSDVAVMRNAKYEMRNAKCVYEDAAPADAEPAVFALPLHDKSEYGITQERINEWAALYPAVDVLQELRKMRGWLDANPARRKTKAGIARFITGWLAREQDKGPPANPPRSSRPKGVAAVENSSLDLEEYEKWVRDYVPVYQKEEHDP